MSVSETKSVPISDASTRAIDSNFHLKCSLDEDGKISSLAIDRIPLIGDGKVLTGKDLSETSVDSLKKALEEVFKDDSEKFPKNKEFKIKSSDKDLMVSTKNPKQFYLITKIIYACFRKSLPIINETKASKITDSSACKIFNIQEAHQNTLIDNTEALITEIPKLTFKHNIAQLKAEPNANKTYVKLLLTALTIGLLAGIIGVGAILPHFGIPYLTSLAIPGIPASLAIPLIGIGLTTFSLYAALKIAAKKSEKAKDYLDAIGLLKSNLFLESNLNDVINTALFILMPLTMIHAPWFATLQGCLAYPTGALLIASGIYQLGESITSLINNRKIKDNKEMMVSMLNILCSISVITMGLLTAAGLINSPITIAVMGIFGGLMVSVNAYNLKKSYDQYKKIKKIDEGNAEDIFNYLKNRLSLNTDEIKSLKDKIDNMSEKEIIDWITKNNKNFEKEQAEIFKKIKEALETAKEIDKEEILKDAGKIMLIEERKNATESKIERLGSLITKETLIKPLENLYENTKSPKDNEEDLIALFATIKKEIKAKTIAEAIKFVVINVPLMVIPFLNIAKLINVALYDYLMAAGLFSNIAVNITPRYRNIPPAMIKKVLDINNALETEEYLKYKNSISNPSEKSDDETSEKIKDVAKSAINEKMIA
ncbi:MAG: hypothetical protein K940chlam5_00110 [Candidatus Anoxychlamydiales bacterium]|nr:hypothetical protein [Candidatus Anoxychlamydiales bacterium]